MAFSGATTAVFTVDASAYISAIARKRLLSWLWLPAALLLGLGVAAMYDHRFAYLMLIVLFIIYPMATSMAWMALAAKKSLTLCTRPQRWVFSTNPDVALTVDFFSFGCDFDNPGAPVHTVCLTAADIERYRIAGRYASVWLRKGATGTGLHVLLIPAASIPGNMQQPLSPPIQ